MDDTAHLHAVLNYCLEFSEEMLSKAGDFYPFGAVVTQDGVLSAVGFSDGDEHPSPQQLYAFAERSITSRAAAGEILAGGLAANVNIPAEYAPAFADGVRVKLEGRDFSRFVYRPYRIASTGLLRKRQTLEFGEIFAVEVPPSFWAADAPG
jgi:hypothetical protein